MNPLIEAAMQNPAGPFVHVAYDAEAGCWRGVGIGDTLAEQARIEAASRQAAANCLEGLRACYEATSNPLYAWTALDSAALDLRAPLPDWLARYLRSAAKGLRIVRRDHADDAPKAAAAVPAALGLLDGNRNAFAEFQKDNDAAWTALSHSALSGDGGREAAYVQLAVEHGNANKERTIRRVVSRAKKNARHFEDTA